MRPYLSPTPLACGSRAVVHYYVAQPGQRHRPMSSRAPTFDEVLELARQFVASALPGEQAMSLRIDLASGRRVQSPIPVVPLRRELPARRHSADFRSVHWDGVEYSFSPTQATVIRILWEGYEDDVPDIGMARLLEDSGSRSDRLRDVFRDNPAWGVLIVVGNTRGTYRLPC